MRRKWEAIAFGVAVHVIRFAVIMGGLALAPLLGISGWYMGLFVNLLCALYAALLVTYFKLWRQIGISVLSRGRVAVLFLLVPVVEALLWLLPDGLIELPPGFGLWAITLLLVGFNEELISRGVVLERTRQAFGRYAAVTATAALFGLQHLSAFATTSRDGIDVITNVLVSACYGFVLAAFQYRFRWIWPLILIHGFADFTTIHTSGGLPDIAIAVTCVVFFGWGIAMLHRTDDWAGAADLPRAVPARLTRPGQQVCGRRNDGARREVV